MRWNNRRHTHPDSKTRVLYKLTDKGIDLIPTLAELIKWSEKYHVVHPMAREFAAQLTKDKEGVIQALYNGLKSQYGAPDRSGGPANT